MFRFSLFPIWEVAVFSAVSPGAGFSDDGEIQVYFLVNEAF